MTAASSPKYGRIQGITKYLSSWQGFRATKIFLRSNVLLYLNDTFANRLVRLTVAGLGGQSTNHFWLNYKLTRAKQMSKMLPNKFLPN